MKIQNTFRRGFTLIELMIVIVILGILMGTILPRLTGAQARARDTARKADLSNISQALELYYNDKGTYPTAPTDNCLDPSGTNATVTALGSYMKGGKLPVAQSKKQKTFGKCDGQYYYQDITSGTVSQASYVLATTVETWQMANYQATDNTAAFSSKADAKTISATLKALDTEPTAESKPLYIVMP